MNPLNSFMEKAIGIVPPWFVKSVEYDGVETVNVELGFDRKHRPAAPACPRCGGACSYYDMVEKTWRHTDVCDWMCIVHGVIPRVKCGSCGSVTRINAPWASDSISKFTQKFEEKVIGLTKKMPVSDVCKEMRLDDSTVWTIIERHVDRCMENQDLAYVDTYYVDEKCIRKGRRYLSTFLDQNHRVIYVGEDNTSETVKGFREHLESRNGCAGNIRHISMDMGAGFKKGAEEYFPDAEPTFDRFHVTEHMTEAVNDTKKREYCDLVNYTPDERGMMKGQKYLFLKNYDNLDDGKKGKLHDLLSIFHDLGIVYRFKETLRKLWDMSCKFDAWNFLMDWIESARRTGIPELIKVTNLLENHSKGILNWYDSHISNGVMEGFNSVLHAFKGRARGYRSFERYRTMIYLRCSGLC